MITTDVTLVFYVVYMEHTKYSIIENLRVVCIHASILNQFVIADTFLSKPFLWCIVLIYLLGPLEISAGVVFQWPYLGYIGSRWFGQLLMLTSGF